jgi:hypothetical protein
VSRGILASIAQLQQGPTAAATTMLKPMLDPNTPTSVRVSSLA